MTLLEQWARDVALETGFVLGEKIYQGHYYSPDRVRNVIFAGLWQGKPAVLKIYDDPCFTDEPAALKAFHETNTSAKITAPALYQYHIASPRRGWLIMERLPEGGAFFNPPLPRGQKEDFAAVFLEYRKNFPQKPTRRLTLAENLPADEYHGYRIAYWFKLATDKEEMRAFKGEEQTLNPDDFLPRYQKVITAIRREFAGRKMFWCHGHFKPSEVYKVAGEELYYLIDFAHTTMYPEGYELAFIIWADVLVAGDWRAPYADWREQIDEWLNIFKSFATELGLNDFDTLMRASILERTLGTARHWPT